MSHSPMMMNDQPGTLMSALADGCVSVGGSVGVTEGGDEGVDVEGGVDDEGDGVVCGGSDGVSDPTGVADGVGELVGSGVTLDDGDGLQWSSLTPPSCGPCSSQS